jgi:hypothetical protein
MQASSVSSIDNCWNFSYSSITLLSFSVFFMSSTCGVVGNEVWSDERIFELVCNTANVGSVGWAGHARGRGNCMVGIERTTPLYFQVYESVWPLCTRYRSWISLMFSSVHTWNIQGRT